MQFELKRGPLFELSGKAARRVLSRKPERTQFELKRGRRAEGEEHDEASAE
jgi:hypothetical protein